MAGATLAVRREIARAFLPNFHRSNLPWPDMPLEVIDSRYWDPEWRAKYGRAYRTTVRALDALGIEGATQLASHESYFFTGRGGVSFTADSTVSAIRENVGNLSIETGVKRLQSLITQPLDTVRQFRDVVLQVPEAFGFNVASIMDRFANRDPVIPNRLMNALRQQ